LESSKPHGSIGKENLPANWTWVLSGDPGYLPTQSWRRGAMRGVRTRFTFRQSVGTFPVWSPDGANIIFAAGTGVPDTIYQKAVNGAVEEKELLKEPGATLWPSDVSRDGRFLLYDSNDPNNPAREVDQWVLPLKGDAKPVLLLGTEFNEGFASFSPDGRWIAFLSEESGRIEVYVRPFVAGSSGPPSLDAGKWQVSKDGAQAARNIGPPRWRNDGKEIVYLAPNNAMMSVEVNGSGASFKLSTPKPLFTAPPNNGGDLTTDHKRLLLTTAAEQGAVAQVPITVVLNWQADLKK